MAFLALASPCIAASIAESGRASAVKILVATQGENYSQPWQGQHVARGSGTGFVISGKRILTNAHLVANAKFIEIQREGDAERYRATVAFIAHDCDLAMLTVVDKTFYEKTSPLPLATSLPDLNDEVIVLGYPLGGNRLSVTKGVVSRIDFSPYSHSGVDQHLALQVDAAINPGNSGGPVVFDDHVVGVAFQGLAAADNIGYAIPLPVVERFLKDVEDGTYHGYPELGIVLRNTRNEALRKDLGLDATQTGIALSYIDPFGAAYNRLQPRDVVLEIDGHSLSNDGTISLDGKRVLFTEIIERMQWGDRVTFRVLRDQRDISIPVPLDHPTDPFIFRNRYDVRPNFYITAGLVFSPISSELLRTRDRDSPDKNVQKLFYSYENVKQDGLYKNRSELVVLIGRLPHPVNTYAEDFVNGIVTEVNGIHVSDIRDVKRGFASALDGFHVISFQGDDDSLVLDASAVNAADIQINPTYGISETEYLHYPDDSLTRAKGAEAHE